MKRRYLLAGLALLAVLAVAAPALGGSSLKKLIKKEVAKQLAGKTGPQGPAGANGTNGTNGTARAYGYVDKFFCAAPPTGACTATDPKKGVSSVTHTATNEYCVDAPGLSPTSEPAVATVDLDESFPGNGSNSVLWSSLNSGTCPAPKYAFRTFDPADPTANVDTSFSFVIP